jgi:hypothetical protein
MAAPYVSYQFKGRRKPENFILYPPKDDGMIQFQSDKSIGRVNLETREGILYLGKSGSAYGVHLVHAIPIVFNMDFVQLIKEAMPKPGTVVSLGGGICQVNS